MNKHLGVLEISVEEHKSLIRSLDDDQYIYMFDGRFRVAVVFDCFDSSYSLLVCASNGEWFCIDAFHDVTRLEESMLACIKAVVSAWNEHKFDSDLQIIGYRWQV